MQSGTQRGQFSIYVFKKFALSTSWQQLSPPLHPASSHPLVSPALLAARCGIFSIFFLSLVATKPHLRRRTGFLRTASSKKAPAPERGLALILGFSLLAPRGK